MRSRIAPLSLLATTVVVLTAGAAGAAPPPAATDLQIGPPPAPVPSIILRHGAAYESEGELHIAVEVADPDGAPVAFDYQVVHIDTDDADFVETAGHVVVPGGVSETSITLPIVQGDEIEGRESLMVVASNPQNADIYDGTGHGSVMDGDGPRFTVADAEVVEGDEGETMLSFDVTASYGATEIITVPAQTAIVGFGAEPPGDYTPVSTDVVFGVGITEATVQVPVIGDTLVEPDELLLLVLDPPSRGELDDGAAVGRILDDDEPGLSVDDVALPEGTGGPTGFHFTVSLDQPALEEVTVTATPTAGTATAPADWQGVPVDVTFEPGQTEADVVVSVVGDSEIEPDETFTVVLADSVGATIADGEGLGTIVDDDAPPAEEDDGEDDGDVDDTDDPAAGGDGGDGATVAGASAERGALPRTGSTVLGSAGLGLLLVLAGAGVRGVRRRFA